jgi:hypothetical protein
MIHSNQLINDHDNSDTIFHIGEALYEKKIFDTEQRRLLLLKAKTDQAIRYFKALREIEFIMVRI